MKVWSLQKHKKIRNVFGAVLVKNSIPIHQIGMKNSITQCLYQNVHVQLYIYYHSRESSQKFCKLSQMIVGTCFLTLPVWQLNLSVNAKIIIKSCQFPSEIKVGKEPNTTAFHCGKKYLRCNQGDATNHLVSCFFPKLSLQIFPEIIIAM